MDVFKKLTPQIKSIIKTIRHFNNAYEDEDYLQEAYLACIEAEKKYVKFRQEIRTKMQIVVYAYMYVQKHLFSMADTGEVVYHMYTPDGEYVKTLRSNEYRKLKKKLTAEGYIFNSGNIVESLYMEDGDGNIVERQIEGGLKNGGREDDGDEYDNN